MKLTQERLPQSQLKLHVEVDPEETATALEVAYRRLSQRVAIPGFRRGKTPRELVERYVGREALLSEAIEHLVPQTYRRVVEENGIQAIAPPVIQVESREPLAFTALVSLKPSVELGDYRELKFPAPAPTVAEEDVSRTLDEFRHDMAPWEPVERPVQPGDLAVMDVQGWVDGQSAIEEHGFQYQVKPSSSLFPGLAKEVEGMRPGEEKEFALPFPQGHLNQGKECRFRVKIAEVKGRQPLPLDDALAQGVNLPDLASLRAEVERQLKAKVSAEAQRELERQVVEAVVAQAKVEYPPVLVEAEIERRLRRQGLQPSPELRQQLEPQVTREVLRSLVLGQLAEAEGIEVTGEEVEAEVAKMVEEGGGEVKRLLSSAPARDSLRDALLVRKTLARLIELVVDKKEAEKSGD